MKDKFINAIHSKNKILLHFFSKEDGAVISRKCAPMDFGPSRRAHDKSDRFHFWDYESDTRNHTLSLLPNQIQSMEVLDENFEPSEFVTWDTSRNMWFVSRDWDGYS